MVHGNEIWKQLDEIKDESNNIVSIGSSRREGLTGHRIEMGAEMMWVFV